MKDKKLSILGILLTLWGILFFCFKLFFPTSVNKLLGNKIFEYSSEQLDQYKLGLENAYTILNGLFIVFLVILIIILFIKLKKMNIKPLSNNSLLLAIFGLILHIIGFVGVSFIFVIISGLLLVTKNNA